MEDTFFVAASSVREIVWSKTMRISKRRSGCRPPGAFWCRWPLFATRGLTKRVPMCPSRIVFQYSKIKPMENGELWKCAGKRIRGNNRICHPSSALGCCQDEIPDPVKVSLVVHHQALLRNKRCLLTYLKWRADRCEVTPTGAPYVCIQMMAYCGEKRVDLLYSGNLFQIYTHL